eukprot:7584894-Alexandrium_andersonii.AAC.1
MRQKALGSRREQRVAKLQRLEAAPWVGVRRLGPDPVEPGKYQCQVCQQVVRPELTWKAVCLADPEYEFEFPPPIW